MKFLAIFAAILALTAGAPAEWSLEQITAALADPSTNPAYIPYLEHGLNQIMDALHAGLQIESVAIPLPAEVISPVPAVEEEAVISPSPVVVAEGPAVISPSPVVVAEGPAVAEGVITPSPAVVAEGPAAVASSPLVQIIVNVNQQDQSAVIPAPVPSPAVVPEIDATPIVVVEQPTEGIPVNPIDVIEVQPVPAPVNPIDVVAVGAPDVNPVDILNPIPVNPAAEAGAIWV